MRSEAREAFLGELVPVDVGGEIELKSGEALALDAQHHDHLRAGEGGFEVANDFDSVTEAERLLRQQLRWAAE